MRTKAIMKRTVSFVLCMILLLNSVLGVSAAEYEIPAVEVWATTSNATAVFDKEEYYPGETVNVILMPENGYVLSEEGIKIISGEESVEYEISKENGEFFLTFQLQENGVEVIAQAKKTHDISFSYKDMSGKAAPELFETMILEQDITEGAEITVSVNYKGGIGWTAKICGASGNVSYEMTSDSIHFIMPDEDVEVEIEEMEVYSKGDLSTEDTILGEDIGKEHQVSTSKEYEPDVSLGKSAKWDDIEKGLATLTLTQKSSSDWSDNPSDYMIVLDRTVSMAVDYSIVYGENSDNMGFGCSVCLNPNHFYMYNGKAAKLIDYGHGFYISSGEYFSTPSFMGNEEMIWNQHYDSTGKRIAPRVYNGCTDRLSIAQKSIKDILNVLESQNQKELAGGKKNRVMYWSFSGENELNDGTWDEVPEFTENMTAVKNAMKYESYPGTYYYNSFKQIQQKLKEKSKDKEYKDIPTKVIFISDGVLYDKEPDKISELAKSIREMPNTKLYTILIGNSKDSEAGIRLKSYATSPSHFATVTSNWDVFVKTITAIQKDQFEIKATEKVVTDVINTEYWEVVGNPILESGNGKASLSPDKRTLTWELPEKSETVYTCKLQLKLKDQYRYLLSDTNYPTNADEEGATEKEILNHPEKAGGTVRYKISGGKYNGEYRSVGVKSPELKYGTVKFEGNKHWTVAGSNSENLEFVLKRTMPGTSSKVEINNTVTNVTKNWSYAFDVRQMPDGTTYPLIKYNNAGEKVIYEVHENVPQYYVQTDTKKTEKNNVVTTDFYNEPFKVKASITKIDEETKNLLTGAEFSVYAWSESARAYVPYKGTNSAMDGSDSTVKLKEEKKGNYRSPVWLYYSTDNLGKFRIIETKAPVGYFGDWKNETVTNSDKDKNVYDFRISNDLTQNGKTIVISNDKEEKFGNQRVKGQIIFTKLDAEGKAAVPQGEAVLLEAVYKLYAAEDIVHQDGTVGVLYKKDQEIKVSATANLKGVNVYTCDPKGNSEMKTASAATIQIDNLELGKYYIKEIKASKGYLIDPKKYEFDIPYADEKTNIVTIKGNVYERVMKQSLSFYKYTADNNADILEPMTGAGFSVYSVSKLRNGIYKDLSDEELVQAVIDDLRNPVTLLYDVYEKECPAIVFEDKDSSDVESGRLSKKVSYKEGKIYEVQGENEYLVTELKADSKGVVKVPALPFGRYVVIETTTPAGKVATRPFVINVTNDEKDESIDGDGKGKPLQDIQLTVLIDRPMMSLVKIMKRDTVSKKIVLKEGASYLIHDVEGAWFDYITNEMTSAQKKEYREKYGDLVVQYSQGVHYGTDREPFTTKLVKDAVMSENVYIETPLQLPNGTYELEEIAAPEGYILQGYEGVIAKDNSKSGNGTYYESEEDGQWKAAPQGRTRFIVSNNESVYNESIRSYVTTVRQENEPAIGKISIYAEGEKLSTVKRGTDTEDYKFEYELSPIEGASFEIRAAEDIYSQEGGINAQRIFKKGDLAVTLTTDKEGNTWTGQEDWEGTDVAKGLPLGIYEIVQVEAGEGFYLSEENRTPVRVELRYAGEEIPVIYRNLGYVVPRQKVKIEVNKTDADTAEALAGAVFGLYTEKEIINNKGQVVVKPDTLIAKATTSSDGESIKNAVFSPDLPHGEYYVKELKAPSGYVTNSEKYEVAVTYGGWQQETVEKLCKIKNKVTKNLFSKTDIISGKKLAGAKFEIWEIMTDGEGNLLKDETGGYVLAEKEAASWISGTEDYLVKGLKAGKTYILREVEAPIGYVGYAASSDETKKANQGVNKLDEEIMFVVQDTEEVVVHEVKNQRVTGNLNITKEGEFLTEAKVTIIDRVKNLISTAFGYLFGRVENVTFGIYVKEDIYTPDGSGQFAEWTNSYGEKILLKGNTLIDEVTTNHSGIAVVENLPLGKYFVKEVSVGEKGNFILSQEIKELELAYVDQDTPVVNALIVENFKNTGIYYVNDRQKVSVRLDKFEVNDKDKKLPVEGAVFGLYTAEKIYGYDVKADKSVRENVTALISADTLIETAASDKKGRVIFNSDLPCGKYYVREIKAAEGYLESSEIFEIDASYTGEKGEKNLEFSFELENRKSEIKIRKTDLYTGKDIEGAALCVVEEDSGRKCAEWTSDGKIKTLTGLKISGEEEHRYLLKEINPPQGYVTAKDVRFKLVQDKNDIGEYLNTVTIMVFENGVWKAAEKNILQMQDDITKIEIKKIDSKTGKMISGANLELRDNDGKVCAVWTSSEKEGFILERLPIGTYRIIETEKMNGYKEAKPMVIEILDSEKMQVFVFENTPEDKKPETVTDTKPTEPPVAETYPSVPTGDHAPITVCICAIVMSLAGVMWARKRRE